MTKVGELYSIIRGFIERGLCGDNAREVSFKTLDAFESAVREDALQQAAIDIARVRSEGVAEGAEQANVGKYGGWVIATADGRFHSFVLDNEGLAQRMCTYDEHVVHVTYGDPTASVLAPTKEKPPITNANNETPETSANNPHELKERK